MHSLRHVAAPIVDEVTAHSAHVSWALPPLRAADLPFGDDTKFELEMRGGSVSSFHRVLIVVSLLTLCCRAPPKSTTVALGRATSWHPEKLLAGQKYAFRIRVFRQTIPSSQVQSSHFLVNFLDICRVTDIGFVVPTSGSVHGVIVQPSELRLAPQVLFKSQGASRQRSH